MMEVVPIVQLPAIVLEKETGDGGVDRFRHKGIEILNLQHSFKQSNFEIGMDHHQNAMICMHIHLGFIPLAYPSCTLPSKFDSLIVFQLIPARLPDPLVDLPARIEGSNLGARQPFFWSSLPYFMSTITSTLFEQILSDPGLNPRSFHHRHNGLQCAKKRAAVKKSGGITIDSGSQVKRLLPTKIGDTRIWNS